MEKLQGPINPCYIAEEMEVGWLEEFISSNTTGSVKYEDPFNHYSSLPSLEDDKMPFLQMLQTVEQQPLMQQLEPANFQFLLRLQHQLVESCVNNTNLINNNNHNHININHNIVNVNNNNDNDMIIMDLHSERVKSENGGKVEEKSSRSNNHKRATSSTGGGGIKEKRKRKRSTTRPAKNKQEVETQRMTHIAVERNRRRQMNEHLTALRSLMPPSYVQRGDQASIIGGAIDFVKELEQMLQSLQAQKRMKQAEENGDVSVSSSSASSSSNMHINNALSSSSSFHHQSSGNSAEGGGGRKSNEEMSAEKKSGLADIEVVVIQNHVNLKIECQRRPGQLIKAIVAFEELRLTILHLNITSLHNIVHYSFNLKIEDDCKLGSADEVARAIHQMFSLINLT